jgi:Leucine-rich repeat (LRR) protein
VHIGCTHLTMIDDFEKLQILSGTVANTIRCLVPTHLCPNPDCQKNHFQDCPAVVGFLDLPESMHIPSGHWRGLFLPPLPSPALRPLQLCQDLQRLFVHGPQITDLDFLVGLPKLQEVGVHQSQVRVLVPLATLPSLASLRLTSLNLEGGGDIDISCLAASTTLTTLDFTGSSSVSNIAPLAQVATLKQITLTGCERVTDRSAFASNPGLHLV